MKIKFSFMKGAKFFVSISVALLLAGIIVLATIGFKLGIDFTGGTIFTLSMGQTVTDNDARAVEDIARKYIQGDVLGSLSENNSIVLKYQDKDADAAESIEKRTKLIDELKTKYPNLTVGSLERVGAVAGAELRRNAILSVTIAFLIMLLYIWFRFEFVTGLVAIIALIHDVAMMTAFMLFTQTMLNSTYIAAMLTIIGYSLNDTIVIFDRIRENFKKFRNLTRSDIIDRSIWETLRRSINVSLTSLVTITVLYILGVQSLKEFAFPLIIGIISGGYSSIFIASPLWGLFENKQKAHA
jgi:preprotein translocase subunit SecF